ncbi:MAG: CDP-alcohol phosphatidyltransferase [Flaviaesturariibacter sp.]|nr:CDP-alcohol phosphatidyltransferase [Flaviaesturariibacter sp.]
MKQVPNLFTLLNLVFGCIAIVFLLQTGETIVVMEDGGATQVVLPEKMAWGALFIFAAAIVDFVDGFLARLLKASSGMGEQLDSLSDMVSFGVAPGMILYQLLRLSFAQDDNGLDVSIAYLLPAFLFTAAVAWRLAKFNISTTQKYHFEGVPSPAAGLVVASFPLILWYSHFNIESLVINRWFLYAVILLLAYLMVSSIPFMAVKFKDYSFKNNSTKFLLLAIAILAAIFLKWLAVPVVFLFYVILSLLSKPTPVSSVQESKEMTDITV